MDLVLISTLSVVAIISVMINAYFIKQALKIDEQLSNQKATIWLLINLCEKNGVALENIESIKKAINLK